MPLLLNAYYEPLFPGDVNASTPEFLASGPNNADTQLALLPSASAELADSDHFYSLELATQASVDLLSVVAGSFRDSIDFGLGNMLGTS
ncbi:hypothetical protein NDU88_005416 [Pleurodeles waltl]|uniref:Uncharacterized protein n=1 Tax=Pleurodeles waltl TaxID=8319 RepID=A0AAV7LP13_PLEWA|nr:hypothetical protein NDU88_005416 [Pleurodeles waltl]